MKIHLLHPLDFFIISLAGIMGLVLADASYSYYGEIVTLIAVFMGFKLTFVGFLFNSPIKEDLLKRKDEACGNKMARLVAIIKRCFLVDGSCIVTLLFLPDNLSVCVGDFHVYFKPMLLAPMAVALELIMQWKVAEYALHYLAHPTKPADPKP